MNSITWFGVLATFMVTTSEATAPKKPSPGFERETDLYSILSSAETSLAHSGRQFASHKVIYYSTNYNMEFNTATEFCQSRGTYIATVEDLEAAYHHGYERCGCGWAANGISYIVMQEANTNCHSSIGISQCSWESNRGVFCRRPRPVFLSKDPRGDYNMTLAEARQHCHGKGSTLATYEDLVHAYHLGYEICSCGWADNGLAYSITQTPNHATMTSVGVAKCSSPMICNALCRSSQYETEPYPLLSSAEASVAFPGRHFATASQKVIYYRTNYNMDYNEARAYCESRGTYIATFQDLMAAYHHGYERSSCGWAANGISYLVIQQAIDGYTSSGVVKCSLESNQVMYYSTNHNMDFNTATAFCQSKGTYIATVEDLEAAYYHGYERRGCGWAANGISYIVMQEANTNCHSSIGISQCSWESNRGVFCRRPTPVFLSKDPRGDYNMTLAEARQHCHGKRSSLATYEDLVHAYHLGYEICSCGWADNGLAYSITQAPNHACMTSVGVVKCSTPMIFNAFCRSSEFETENYPLSSLAEASSALSGRQFAIASQKVIYYPTNYNMDHDEARAYCESRGTYIATFQDLLVAYHHGYERFSCGWAANGISYLAIQQAIDGYTSS